MVQSKILDALISEYCDIACACNFELASSSQISADNSIKLFGVMGFSKGVQMHLTRWVNCRNECRR